MLRRIYIKLHLTLIKQLEGEVIFLKNLIESFTQCFKMSRYEDARHLRAIKNFEIPAFNICPRQKNYL